jgi:hypothetical protein
MLDLDDVSPDGYNVQGLRHAGEDHAHPFSQRNLLHRIYKRQLQTAVSSHPLKIGHMFM